MLHLFKSLDGSRDCRFPMYTVPALHRLVKSGCVWDTQSFQTSGIFKYHATYPHWKVPAFWTVTLFLRFLESFYPHWQFLQCVIPKKKKIELSTELGLLRLKKARCCPGESERRSGSSMKPDKRRQTLLTDWACVLFFSRAFVPTSIPPSSRISHTHSINSSKKPAGRFWSILGLKD